MKSLISIILVCAFLLYTPVVPAAETAPGVGTVAEALQSGGYVYIRFEDGVWIAANSFPVSEGDRIQYGGAMEMNDFYSKTLDRTFDSILFVSQAGPVTGDGASPAAVPTEERGGQGMKIPKSVAVPAPTAGEIAPLADGKTVAAIFADSGQLKDQVVSLNAKVIKISKNIMGKNWITLQDGTGTEPDDRLMATSKDMVEPGSIVVVKGTVKTDVDLGYGYLYKVLLEDASFSPAQQ